MLDRLAPALEVLRFFRSKISTFHAITYHHAHFWSTDAITRLN